MATVLPFCWRWSWINGSSQTFGEACAVAQRLRSSRFDSLLLVVFKCLTLFAAGSAGSSLAETKHG